MTRKGGFGPPFCYNKHMPAVKQFPQLNDAQWLRAQYEGGKTMYDIATEIGCSGTLVYHALKRHGIQARKGTERIRDFKKKRCRRCGSLFQPTAPSHLFCGCDPVEPDCDHCHANPIERNRAGNKRWTYYSKAFCSAACKDEYVLTALGPNRYTTEDGYVLVRVGESVPGAYKTGYMREHRYVMQEYLGRPLGSHETVHHINGDTADNRLDNLQLRSGKHGTGVVFRCLDCGSQNIEAEEIAVELP